MHSISENEYSAVNMKSVSTKARIVTHTSHSISQSLAAPHYMYANKLAGASSAVQVDMMHSNRHTTHAISATACTFIHGHSQWV